MSELQENKMGVMPIKRLVLSMSLPMMISMLVQALYTSWPKSAKTHWLPWEWPSPIRT